MLGWWTGASQLVRHIRCQINLTESGPRSLLICPLLAINLLVLTLLPLGLRVKLGRLIDLDPYGGTDSLDMFLHFLKITADVLAPDSRLCFGSLFVWVVSMLAGDSKFHPNSERSRFLLYCQLPTIFTETTVLSKVFERLVSVRLGRFMERSASNHYVCLSEMAALL